MSRVILSLAKPPAPARGPSLSMVKEAIRFYRNKHVPKALWRKNAKQWIAKRMAMGDRHILNAKFSPTWGQPGDGRGVSQIFAPRRLGERA